MELRSGNKIYLRNMDSEKMRNENDMLRLRQKLANERLKPKIVRQFQMLIEDDRNIIKNHYLANNKNLSKNRSTVGHANEESHITINVNDDAVSPLSIKFPADKNEDNTIENDSHTKHEQSDIGYDKMAEDYDGIVENESYIDIEHETMSVSKTIHDDQGSSAAATAAEERSPTATVTTSRNLSALEAFGVAYTLERWVDRIAVLSVLNGMDDADDDVTDERNAYGTHGERRPSLHSERIHRKNKLRVFILNTFEQTARELRSSGTFTELRRANDLMLKTIRDERELEAELSANRAELNVLQNKKKKHKQCHDEEKWWVEKRRQCLAEKLEKTLKLIETENKYQLSWEDLWLDENKELLKEEEKHHLNQIQIIDADNVIEDSCMREAKRIFAEYTAVLDHHVLTWEDLYTTYVGAIDINILTLEQEQEYLNDSHERMQEYVDDLQSSIEKFEERKNERDERQRVKTHINNMAIMIQAFWRGMMVRRFLGRFKTLKKRFKKKRMMAKKNE